MKRSEKLFLAINEIDDKLVDEAKTEEQKPVRIKLEKRKPIKEIVAIAACFAVIAAAMFALVKFKLSEDIDAIESNSTDSSYDSSDMSDDSDHSDRDNEFPLHLSEDDLALQEILKELIPYTEDIDELFNYRPAAGGRYKFNYTDSYGDERSEEYYRFYDGMRSTNDLFNIPQSYDEMETLLTRYFSRLAAESYLGNVSKTDSTKSFNGWYYDIDSSGANTFIETDGKLFFRPYDFGYLGMGIDPSTAKVKRKTDNLIEFWYWYEDISDFNGGEYSSNIGYIVKENGEWKLHYFDYYGFTSAIPAEYTEDDLELQEILETLKGGDKLSNLFRPDITKRGTYYNLAFPEIPGYEQGFGYIDLSSAEQYYDFPSSYEDFKQQLSQYFSREATNEFMKNVAKGTMTETADGVYSVKLTESRTTLPTYIDIDGRMYYISGAGGYAEENLFNTAKLIERTDDTIIYSYTFSNHGELQRLEGRLVYENGGWKRDEFYDPAANKDEFQEILSEILPAARDLDNMFNTLDPSGEEYVFVYSDGENTGNKSSYYPVTDSLRTKPNDLFAVPQSRSEMEELLLKYFSKRAVNSYMEYVSTGSMTQNADGTYSVITDQDRLTPFIEIDGRLYCDYNFDVETLDFDPSTASVITKTDKTIKFKYTADGNVNDKEGALVYENGGWKLNHFKWGFISVFPTEFTAEDEELQDILNELSPSVNIAYWFNTAGDTYNADQFIFEGLENSENYPTHYIKLETGKFDGGKEEYPRSYDELRALLSKYFTQQTVDYFAKRSNKGTITSGSDKKYYVKTEKPITDVSEIPSVIELDGVMYHMISDKSPGAGVLWDSAQVISKTDDTIEYSYVQQFKEYTIESGTLKFERGGWRVPLISE